MKSNLKPGLHPSLVPLGARTLKSQAVDVLRAQILRGQLAPGSTLRDEELAELLGISRTPLREALVQLAAEGLIEILPNRYKRVAPISRRSLHERLDLFQIIARAAYERAAPRLTPEIFRRMQAALRAQDQAIAARDWYGGIVQGHQFQHCIYAATGNAEMVRVLDRLLLPFSRLTTIVRPAADRVRWHLAHKVILKALQDGDAASAIDTLLAITSEIHALIDRLPAPAGEAASPSPRRRPSASPIASRRATAQKRAALR